MRIFLLDDVCRREKKGSDILDEGLSSFLY